MTNNMRLEDLPSKKYNDELKKEIHYEDIDNHIEIDTFSSEDVFWKTTLYDHVRDYINNHIDLWPEINNNKRCRDFNNILDIILKKVKKKKETKPKVSYDLIASYINSSAEIYLKPWEHVCKRNSKFNEHNDDIENEKNVDDFCEDIDYIKKRFSEINSDNCKEIEDYITQQVRDFGETYTTLGNKYSNILGYYRFTSSAEINTIVENLKSKCKELTAGALLAGDRGEMQNYSGRNASIVAVTSLSGILSSALLLYKTTPFGSILNNVIQKRLKFGNNLNEEIDYETLEAIPESSHNGSYNILYNTVGDS
ncbi:PIR Superfamily Protein [Plasmodium ovale wallikeri]|uniref:PIR Superfamily Protein n=1 Tax=Plasmodium ovale wallikeri TaxID=864142 RepID=A0A1A9ATL8_PLAOA|nr:PIR Superfamily Protein [Plasmodium ovale wallikeri]SBT59471.1 PIR Superfamily Protein [Plasmodium ovale wallikeri]